MNTLLVKELFKLRDLICLAPSACHQACDVRGQWPAVKDELVRSNESVSYLVIYYF